VVDNDFVDRRPVPSSQILDFRAVFPKHPRRGRVEVGSNSRLHLPAGDLLGHALSYQLGHSRLRIQEISVPATLAKVKSDGWLLQVNDYVPSAVLIMDATVLARLIAVGNITEETLSRSGRSSFGTDSHFRGSRLYSLGACRDRCGLADSLPSYTNADFCYTTAYGCWVNFDRLGQRTNMLRSRAADLDSLSRAHHIGADVETQLSRLLIDDAHLWWNEGHIGFEERVRLLNDFVACLGITIVGNSHDRPSLSGRPSANPDVPQEKLILFVLLNLDLARLYVDDRCLVLEIDNFSWLNLAEVS
jgi:hypothetical protein